MATYAELLQDRRTATHVQGSTHPPGEEGA
jgi:hypothetical protein